MSLLSTVLVVIVALEHIYILILEMFLWTTPKGIKTFGIKSKEFANESKVLAANQGLYNGFLAAGLFYSLYTESKEYTIFFLICVTIAALYGSYSTAKSRILIIQGIPAILALISILITKS